MPYKDITTSGAAALALSFGRTIIAPFISSFPEVITADSGILYDTSQRNALVSVFQAAPWRGIIFSEKAIMRLRREFYRPTEEAERFQDIIGGLNKFSYSEFVDFSHQHRFSR